jgi:hypothetical protein
VARSIRSPTWDRTPSTTTDSVRAGSLAPELRTALETTFSKRQRHELPSSLPAPPADWAAPYSRLAIDVGVDAELMAAFTRAAAFLDPILAGRSAGTWDAARERWS